MTEMPACAQLLAQRRPNALLIGDQSSGAFADPYELLAGAEAVGAERRDALIDHADQSGHAHHVEFVEVRGGNRQEAQPLQHGMAAVLRFLQARGR